MAKYETTVFRFVKQGLSWKPLAFLGTFAYSIYLIHAPLLQVLAVYVIPVFHVDKFASTMILIFGGGAVIVALSYVFFLLCEKPFLNKRAVPKKVALSNAVKI